MLSLLLAVNSWAGESAGGSTANATGSADANVQITNDFSDKSVHSGSEGEKRQHMMAIPGTAGMFPFPSGPGSVGQWILLIGQPLLKSFEYQILDDFYVKNMKIWDHKIRNKHLQETVYSKNIVPNNKESIVRLDWAPQGDVFYPGDKLLAEIEIIGSHEWTSTASLLLGLRRAKELTQTKRVIVWLRYVTKHYNDGMSLGSGGAVGSMFGPSNAIDNKAMSIALGGLIGTTEAGQRQAVDVRIWCLNDGPISPPIALAKKEEARTTKPEIVPPALKAEAAPASKRETAAPAPNCAKCEAELEKEKKASEEFAKRAMEEAEKAKKAEDLASKKVEKIEACSASLLFPINEYLPTLDSRNIEEAKKMVKWLLEKGKEVKKQGGKIVMVGGCDERLAKVYKQTDKRYAAKLKSLVSTNEALATEYHPNPTDSDIINWPLGGKRSRMSIVMLARAADEMKVLDQVSDIIKGIEKVSSGKDWLVFPDKPLDEKNRYAMLAVVIGGPGAVK